MEVNAVMPAVLKYMLWSDQEITWSFKDHPKIMPNPGGYALVVDPIMHGPTTRVKFSKVLIDNGSSINIMYRAHHEHAGHNRKYASANTHNLPWNRSGTVLRAGWKSPGGCVVWRT
jgi:hypothetical protein